MHPGSVHSEVLGTPPQDVEVVGSIEKKCEITEGARQLLESWGTSDTHINELMQLAARYEYNNVEAQAKGVAQRTAIISQDEQGQPVVILPNFFDLEGDRQTGQCSEISFKVLRDMVNGGWFGEVNAANLAAGRIPVEWNLVQGKPSEHFAQHYWINIHQKGDESSTGVIIDGSLEHILLQSEGNYAPVRTRDSEDVFYIPQHETLRIAKLTSDEAGNWKINGGTQSFLGMTPDYNLGVDLCFGANSKGDVQPIILAYDNSNESIAGCARIDGRISWLDNNNIVDGAHRTELERALGVLERMPVSRDPSAYKRYEDDNVNNPQEMDLSDMSRV